MPRIRLLVRGTRTYDAGMAANHEVQVVDDALAGELFPAGVLTLDGASVRILMTEDGAQLSFGMGSRRRLILLTDAGPLPRFIHLNGMHWSGAIGYFLRWCHQQTVEYDTHKANGRKDRAHTQQGIHVIASDVGGGRSEQGSKSVPTLYWLTPRDHASDAPEFRAAQHEASQPDSDTGTTIARKLIGKKIQGQIDVLTDLYGGRNVQHLQEQLALLADADLKGVRDIEKATARKYFDAWREDELYRSEDRHPQIWDAYRGRNTGVKNDRRDSKDPVNATLNYLYTWLATAMEVTMSLTGLDPAIGVSHTTHGTRRNSGALDLMEALRPQIDRYVIVLFRNTTWQKDDFTKCGDYTANDTGYSGQPNQVLLGKRARKLVLAGFEPLYHATAALAEEHRKDLHKPTMKSKPSTKITGRNNVKAQAERKSA